MTRSLPSRPCQRWPLPEPPHPHRRKGSYHVRNVEKQAASSSAPSVVNGIDTDAVHALIESVETDPQTG